MPLLSVQISENLNEQLKSRAKEMGDFTLSTTVRHLLSTALESKELSANQQIQRKLIEHNIAAYCMIQEHLVNSFEEGNALNDRALAKAAKIVDKLLRRDLKT